MFTGIVEYLGVIAAKQKVGGQVRFKIKLKRKIRDLKLGESIAVNGTCLTVTQKSTQSFSVDVVQETLKATALGDLKVNDIVNLERSLKYGDRMGGHFVWGHVDGVGKVESIEKAKKNQLWTIKAPKNIMRYIIKKGSVAIDGISLTVQHVSASKFQVALIPHTLQVTHLKKKGPGSRLNIEVDMVVRSLDELLKKPGKSSKPDKKLLKKLISQGF